MTIKEHMLRKASGLGFEDGWRAEMQLVSGPDGAMKLWYMPAIGLGALGTLEELTHRIDENGVVNLE